MKDYIENIVENVLRSYDLLDKNMVLLLALSGGADSVALLYMLNSLSKKHGFLIRASHVEHGLRDEASLQDAQFCEKLCKQLGVSFTCDHVSVAGDMNSSGVEQRAREARYDVLVNRAKQCNASVIVLAHHINDQAETVLSRLIRGSGTHGLAGMTEKSFRDNIVLLRPMLGITKEEILTYLDNIEYCTDETNFLLCCQRNRIRMKVLPLLEQENPNAVKHIASTAKLLSLDDNYLSSLANELLSKSLIAKPPYFCIRKTAMKNYDDAIAIRTLRCFVDRAVEIVFGKDLPAERALSANDSLKLLDLIKSSDNQTLNLPNKLCALSTEHYIHIVHMNDMKPINTIPTTQKQIEEEKTINYGTINITIKPYDAITDKAPNGLTSIVLPNSIVNNVVVRTYNSGDKIASFGCKGTKLLRRYFTDHKVDAPFRNFIPLLCAQNNVLWVMGVGASEDTRLKEQPSSLISITGMMPWLIEK